MVGERWLRAISDVLATRVLNDESLSRPSSTLRGADSARHTQNLRPSGRRIVGTSFAHCLRMGNEDRVVVIGTGSAGAAAAVFLHRARLRPLVLEAGFGRAA